MRALVVYESMFGNTRAVASAIARGLETRMAVDLFEVSTAPDRVDDGVDLVVAGDPTPPPPSTRRTGTDVVGLPGDP